ncbi:MAG: hypothetical protein WCS18_12525 [Sphaerochaetaceae bacterium]
MAAAPVKSATGTLGTWVDSRWAKDLSDANRQSLFACLEGYWRKETVDGVDYVQVPGLVFWRTVISGTEYAAGKKSVNLCKSGVPYVAEISYITNMQNGHGTDAAIEQISVLVDADKINLLLDASKAENSGLIIVSGIYTTK